MPSLKSSFFHHLAYLISVSVFQSRYTVTRYQFDGIQAGLFAACLLQYWILLTPHPISSWEPWIRSMIPMTFQYILFAVPPFSHILETTFIMYPLLNKHRVVGKLRWQYLLGAFASGSGAIRRFNIELKKDMKVDAKDNGAGQPHSHSHSH